MKVSYSSRVGRALARILAAALFLLPLWWLLATSLTRPSGSLLTAGFWPAEPTVENYRRLWVLLPLARYTFNSVRVVLVAVPVTLVVASWAGLALALLPRASRYRWIVFSLAVLMVPAAALWLPRFFLYRLLGWHGSLWALVAPAWMGTSPFFVLVYFRSFRRLAPALFDAARIDGAGVFQLWWRVGLPLVRPTTLGSGLLAVLFYWGDFVSPLLYLNSEAAYTLPVALQLLQQLARADWPLLMAGAVWTAALPVALFLLVQPWLQQER
ncbi:MAG: carbohydrate ABC transporter permease [Anaerolineae bacterium]|nr:carbohydrate ABC transporter permease [Anaerolineae bacterium]